MLLVGFSTFQHTFARPDHTIDAALAVANLDNLPKCKGTLKLYNDQNSLVETFKYVHFLNLF